MSQLLKQYREIKEKYHDALVLFRINDFYETFGDDAIKVAETIGTVLTKKDNVPMTGFPFYGLDTYFPKLVRSGFRVAIVEQIENPK